MGIVGDVKAQLLVGSGLQREGGLCGLGVVAQQIRAEGTIDVEHIVAVSLDGLITMWHQHITAVAGLKEPEEFVGSEGIIQADVIFQVDGEIGLGGVVNQMITGGDGQLPWIIEGKGLQADGFAVVPQHISEGVLSVSADDQLELERLHGVWIAELLQLALSGAEQEILSLSAQIQQSREAATKGQCSINAFCRAAGGAIAG